MVKPPPADKSPIPLDLTPIEVAARCAHLPGMVFFDTALPLPDSSMPSVPSTPSGGAPSAFSFVAVAPSEILSGSTEADWAALEAALAARRPSPEALMENEASRVPPGFAAGWVEYDGSFCFGFYDRLLACRHGASAAPEGPRGSGGDWFCVGGLSPELAEALSKPAAPAAHPPVSAPPPLRFSPGMERGEYLRRVERAQEYIASGDIYQVNLSHRFSAPWQAGETAAEEGAARFRLYEALRQASPAPYAAYLSLRGRSVLSSSPELFLEISGRRIRTRPIKGTRPRRASRDADEKSARDLVTSPKENAELVMITDLERNDLGRVCEFGSVTVREMLKLERYEQVFHLVSTVEGTLQPEMGAVAALRACFPGGSITGAPKKRAMEIIAELEPIPRGLYTGAIGYFGFNGESQFSIAIRTLVIDGGKAHFHVGAGIVADSRPDQEWQETLDKAAGILLAAQRLGRPDSAAPSTSDVPASL